MSGLQEIRRKDKVAQDTNGWLGPSHGAQPLLSWGTGHSHDILGPGRCLPGIQLSSLGKRASGV